MPSILITVATRWECAPLAHRWNLRASPPEGFHGRVGKCDVRVVQTGMGQAKASQALGRVHWTPESSSIVISSGFAGALQPGIRSGDVVADLRDAPIELAQTLFSVAKRQGTPLHVGAFHTSERTLSLPQEKRRAGMLHRAVAVDLESDAVRRWCRGTGTTFLIVRAVLDRVQDTLPDVPEDIEAWPTGRLASYALRRWHDAPRMLATYMRQRRAGNALALFLDGLLREL